jgi:hypothetical protein
LLDISLANAGAAKPSVRATDKDVAKALFINKGEEDTKDNAQSTIDLGKEQYQL